MYRLSYIAENADPSKSDSLPSERNTGDVAAKSNIRGDLAQFADDGQRVAVDLKTAVQILQSNAGSKKKAALLLLFRMDEKRIA